jgi:fatty-acyl-CoA synthase
MRTIDTVTLENYENTFAGRHRIHDALDYWAARKPAAPVIINATRGSVLTYAELAGMTRALAGHLQKLGYRKGDFLATSLPLPNEHIVLEYACFRAGIIHVPLDLRLAPAEVLRCLGLIQARGFVHLGKTPTVDFSPLGAAVRQHCPWVEHVWDAPQAMAVFQQALQTPAPLEDTVDEHEGAQVIFTTGSTGAPKPALLSHRGITTQNLGLGTAFGFGPDQRVLINLPASHVGCQSELLMTTLFLGGTAVTLEIFDAALSLTTLERDKVTLLGQIPAMFQLLWRQPGYENRDISSLQTAVYGGQSVPRPFLEKMRTMAPRIGTGLGLTEASGFCTYTPATGDVDEVARSIGHAAPIYPMSIREPMHGDSRAGAEVPNGTVGHVCFKGPQTFLGYVNDPEATARAVSSDGWLYTGDLGFLDSDGLRFSGRAKWVIKPAGNQVFPGEVEEFLCRLSDQVASAGVVGAEHRIWSEAIVAFVEKKPGATLTEADLRRHARGLTSYMRPRHYVILEPGQMPLNRVAKVDALKLTELARDEVRKLRERGRWDRQTEDEV